MRALDTGTQEKEVPSWHAQSSEQIFASLDAKAEGIADDEAKRRLSIYGENILPQAQPRRPLLRFLAQFNNMLVWFLLVGAAAAALLDHLIDAAVIVAVLLFNAAMGFIQEGRAERALDAIRELIAPQASVIRDGRRRTVPVRELVPGDIILIEAGDRVPADLRLVYSRRLLIDEALLTGESLASEKNEAQAAANAPLGDQRCMAFSGTLVAAGQARGLVVATGAATQLGRISTLVGGVSSLATPLLKQIDRFARRFTGFVVAAGAVLFAFAVLVRGYDWVEALVAIVALAVGIVPEGLPAVITITLALGVRRMAARRAVIRKLPAVETLGAVSVICTDKTGTLTRNEMTARRVMIPAGALLATGSGYDPRGALAPAPDSVVAASDATPLLLCGLLCNDAALRKEQGEWRVDGDPMEGALQAIAMKAGIDPGKTRGEWPRLDVIPFDAAHRFMATLNRGADGDIMLFVKGAPEALLAMTEQAGGDWEMRIAEAAREGERVLAFGRKVMSEAPERLELHHLQGVELLGLVGFIDPPRPEAPAAIAECRSAGIAVKMITGDHIETALAIARQLTVADQPRAITGSELEAMSDDELRQAVGNLSVFARTSPEHKLRIVRALQANGLAVAMTGDGVNDAPSLKQADVGVAMGIKGTEASKEAAEMVLLDDNFASIVAAVREGRTVYANIRKLIAWEIPSNGGETLAVVLAILLGFALPMTATQILWSNLILAATLGIVLAFEPAEPGVMTRRPRRRDAPLLSPFLIWRVAVVSALLTAAALGVFFHTLSQGRDLETARTMVVNAFVVCEIFYLFNVRYMHMTSFSPRGAMGTPAVLGAIALLIAAQLAFTYVPFMNRIFDSRPLRLEDGVLLVAIGLSLMLILEAEKALVRRLGWFEELNT